MANRLIHFIADYGVEDPAFNESIQRLLIHSNESLMIRPTAVPAFDTIGTGFWISQYALGEHPEGMMIFSNTAPRKDEKQAREHNAGEGLMFGETENGVRIVAVNSGYCFSFVKPHLTRFSRINVENKGSQFRSRDFYPTAFASLMQSDELLQ